MLNQCIIRPVSAKVWSSRRKWMGNLIPALAWLVPTVPGLVICYVSGNYLGLGFWLVLSGLILGLVVLNQFGFFENSKMRAELLRIVVESGELKTKEPIFVGFASEGYSSMLDAHQDVGFLAFEKHSIVFASEARRFEIVRSSIVRVRFRPNVHSLFGLGRWICVETAERKYYFEPREGRTLLANRRQSKALKQRFADR